MKRHLILPTVGLAGIAGLMFAASAQGLPLPAITLSPSPSPSPSISESPSPEPEEESDVTADIRVELDLPSFSSGPMVFEVIGVPVDDSIELFEESPISNPSDWCGDATVDIAADLSGVVITGGEGYCNFEEAYVFIELHGAEWGDVELVSDTLFLDDDSDDAQIRSSAFSGSFGGAGKGAFSAGLHLAPTGGTPTLQFAGVDGSIFEAYWFGESSLDMAGVASFAFAAPGAVPVEGEPTFTG
jgi:hypothetical protein